MQGPEAPPLFMLRPLALGPAGPPERRKDRRMETWEGCGNQHPGCARHLFLLSASHPPRSPVTTAASPPAPMTLVSRMGRVPDRETAPGAVLPFRPALDADLLFLSRRACWTSRLKVIFSSSVKASYSSSPMLWRRSFSLFCASLRLCSGGEQTGGWEKLTH